MRPTIALCRSGPSRGERSPGPLLEEELSVGFASATRGLGLVALGGATSGESWPQNGAVLRLSPVPTAAGGAEGRARRSAARCLLSPLLCVRLRETPQANLPFPKGLPRNKAKTQHQTGPGGLRRSGSRPTSLRRATFPWAQLESLPPSLPLPGKPGGLRGGSPTSFPSSPSPYPKG